MQRNRRALSGAALAVLAVLFVAVMLVVNTGLRGMRVDLTRNQLHTLSAGTRSLLGKLDEPVNLYLFFSDRAAQGLPHLRTYAGRVRELLDEMAARSGGKLRVETIDPLPFSEDEDRATSFGLQSVPVGAGDRLFFGLAGTNSTDGRAAIPFLQPDKEGFLEYDIAKLVHELSRGSRPVVGLVSSLPVTAGFDPASQRMREPWAVVQEWEQLFELRSLDAAGLQAIDEEIDQLVLIHPRNLSEDAQFAIDQFVLRGGHLLVFVDPDAELDGSGAEPGNPMAAMMADKASDLPRLFQAWGLEYDPAQVVLDRSRAVPISTGAGQAPVRHPAILGLTASELNQDDVVTAQLDSINMSSTGFIELAESAEGMQLEPLVQSTGDAMAVPAERLKMLMDPSSLMAGYRPAGRPFVLAGRLSGIFRTAFPERAGEGVLKESAAPGQVIVFADTDVLSDRLWVQVQSFFGQRILNPFANNGDLAVNLVDNLTGSGDLISIRGRATSQRPFTTVEELRRMADDRFRAKEQELQQELAETERRLGELQGAKSSDEALILSPEQRREIDSFMQRKLEIRKELRQVRRQLDAEIESLGTRLRLLNILLMPALVSLAALGFAWWRSRRRRLAQGAHA